MSSISLSGASAIASRVLEATGPASGPVLWQCPLNGTAVPIDTTDYVEYLPLVDTPAVPLDTTDYAEYLRTFAGNLFLQPLHSSNMDRENQEQRHDAQAIEQQAINSYLDDLRDKFSHETAAQEAEALTYALHVVLLDIYDSSRSLYRLDVPGIQHGYPRVYVRDTVTLYQFHTDRTGKQRSYSKVATIHAIHRQKESLILHVDNFLSQFLPCSVKFTYPRFLRNPFQRTLNLLSGLTSHKSAEPHTLAQRYLSHTLIWYCHMVLGRAGGVSESGDGLHPLFDNQLNLEQQVFSHISKCFLQKYLADSVIECCPFHSDSKLRHHAISYQRTTGYGKNDGNM